MGEETTPDADVTNDDVGSSHTASIGDYDVLKLNWQGDAPGGLDKIISIVKDAQDADAAALAKIAANAQDLGFTAVGAFADPLNYLVSAGLGFLVDVVQPLEDLLGLVTGNAERMQEESKKWERVGQAIGPLADEIRRAVDEGLVGWKGDAGTAARQRLQEFAAGVESLATDVAIVKGVVDVAAAIMSAVQAVVLSLLSVLIEWLVITWVSAMAAAAPTCGASTAAAGAATTAEVAVTTGRAGMAVQRAGQLLTRLNGVTRRTMDRMVQRAIDQEGWTEAGVLVGPGRLVKDILFDPDTWKQQGLTVAGAAARSLHDTGSQAGDTPYMSRSDQDRALDLDR